MNDIKNMMQNLMLWSDMVADAIIKKIAPYKDDISENKARKLYGDKWLRNRKEEGLAVCHRIGGRNIYSRHQLDCLREAEREHAEHAKLLFKK